MQCNRHFKLIACFLHRDLLISGNKSLKEQREKNLNKLALENHGDYPSLREAPVFFLYSYLLSSLGEEETVQHPANYIPYFSCHVYKSISLRLDFTNQDSNKE